MYKAQLSNTPLLGSRQAEKAPQAASSTPIPGIPSIYSRRVRWEAPVSAETGAPSALTKLHIWPHGQGVHPLGSIRATFSEGGNVTQFVKTLSPLRSKSARRGAVWEFSKAAGRRLYRFAMSLDRSGLRCDDILFGTLTYPKEFSRDERQWKRDLAAFRRRFERRYGAKGIIWKLEPQKRQAPHFHLIINLSYGNVMGGLQDIQGWAAQAWYEIVGSGDEKHRWHGTDFQNARTWNGVASYCSSYLGGGGKGELEKRAFIDRETGELIFVGRHWGVWNKEDFGRHLIEYQLRPESGMLFVRWARRYARSKGYRVPGRGRSGFVLYGESDVLRDMLGSRAFADAVQARRVARVGSVVVRAEDLFKFRSVGGVGGAAALRTPPRLHAEVDPVGLSGAGKSKKRDCAREIPDLGGRLAAQEPVGKQGGLVLDFLSTATGQPVAGGGVRENLTKKRNRVDRGASSG